MIDFEINEVSVVRAQVNLCMIFCFFRYSISMPCLFRMFK